MTIRLLTIPVLAALLAACGETADTGTNSGPGAASFVIVSGNAQTGAAGLELPQPLVVRATDGGGNPVPGRHVSLVVVAGGGAMFVGGGVSDASGIVKDYWTLGNVAGQPQQVEARSVDPVTGQKLIYGVFTATAVPGAVARVEANGIPVSGYQTTVSYILPDSMRVHLKDQFGNRVRQSGIVVTWTPSGDGRVSTRTSATDTAGVARVRWAFSTVAGPQQLVASVPGATSQQFDGVATPHVPFSVTITPDSVHMTALQLAVPLSVTAVDKYGNAVPFTWSSLNNNVVSISSGAPRAVANGTTRVIATAGTRRDTAAVSIQQVASSITFSPSLPTSTTVGGTINVRNFTTVRDANNQLIANPGFTWGSTNGTVATLSAAGVLTGQSAGTAKATATVNGVYAETPTITVNP